LLKFVIIAAYARGFVRHMIMAVVY